MKRTGQKKGFTLIELAVVIAVIGIMASAFISVFIPTVNFLYYFPRNVLAQNAAADLLQIIFEGDNRARGLRFTGLPCTFPTGGAIKITTATSLTLTYNYAEASHCYTGSGFPDHTIALIYSAANQTVTRNIDGGGAQTIPYYTQTAGELNFDEIENENVGAASLAFFRYWDSTGAEIDGSTPANIRRVDIAFRVLTASGNAKYSAASAYMKSGVDIKQTT